MPLGADNGTSTPRTVDIRRRILDVSLPKHMRKHAVAGRFYPVVVGGQAVLRCDTARVLDRPLFFSDVDIKFVVLDEHVPDSEVHQARMAFLQDVLADFPDVPLTVDDRGATDAKMTEVFPIKLVTVKLDKEVLMDTTIYRHSNVDNYGLYARCVAKAAHKTQQQPIPYNTVRGVPYATCSYAYFDNVRTVIYYHNLLKVAPTPKRRLFAFNKYVRGLAKFCALYTLLKRSRKPPKEQQQAKDAPKTKRNKVIADVYERARELLVSTAALPEAARAEVPASQQGVLDALLQQLRDTTDLDTLVACIHLNRRALPGK